MASEKDFELLDDYVTNRLKGADKQAFEEKLKADADLQTELRLQQHIINSVRNARAAELKTMLNNIPPSSIPLGPTSLGKWAGAASVVIVAAGLYFYLSSDRTEKLSAPKDTTSLQAPVETAKPPVVTEPDLATPPTQENARPEVSADDKTPSARKKSSTKNQVSEEKEEARPNLDVFDPSEETTDSDRVKTEVPALSGAKLKSDIPTEINSTNKSYTFHYQFKDQKLILFGAFDKNLYEILEFISDNKRTIFLYYKNSYYLLTPTGDKVTPLSPVNDPVLLQKLKEYRNQP